MFFNRQYIPKEGLDALKNYKYQGGGYTWLDTKMNPFWNFLAELLPMTMAANLVTLIGTLHLLLMGLMTWYYDPRLLSEAPDWVYFLFAYIVFAYQTLDAVDGKQARRTGTSSPLGQLFDHGCDALGTTYCVISLCTVLGYGPKLGTLVLMATVQIPFYFAQWQENHTHVLQTGVGQFGVTEALFVNVGVILLRAIFGKVFWTQTVGEFLPILAGLPYVSGLSTRSIAVTAGAIMPFLGTVECFIRVFKKMGFTGFIKSLILLNPLMLYQAMLLYITNYPPASEIFSRQPVVVLLVAGLLFSQICSRIIVGSVCHLEFPWMHKILAPIPFILGYFHFYNPTLQQVEYTLAFYAFLIILHYAHYVKSVTSEICHHLDIYCLSIKPKTKKA